MVKVWESVAGFRKAKVALPVPESGFWKVKVALPVPESGIATLLESLTRKRKKNWKILVKKLTLWMVQSFWKVPLRHFYGKWHSSIACGIVALCLQKSGMLAFSFFFWVGDGWN